MKKKSNGKLPHPKAFKKGNKIGFAAHPEKINRQGLNRKSLPTLHKLLTMISEDDFKRIMYALVRKASRGDIAAVNVILDRMFGKPHQSISQGNMNVELTLSEYLDKLSGEPLKAALKQLENEADENNNLPTAE